MRVLLRKDRFQAFGSRLYVLVALRMPLLLLLQVHRSTVVAVKLVSIFQILERGRGSGAFHRPCKLADTLFSLEV